MIPFNLTALTRPTPFIQRNAKTRESFHSKTLRNFTPSSFIVSILNQNSRSTSNLFFSITALKYFKKKAMADMTTTFPIEEDEEPWQRSQFISRAMRANTQIPTQFRTTSLNGFFQIRLTS